MTPDTFIQDASSLWSDPSLSREDLTLCKVCWRFVEPGHDTDRCIEEWGRQLRVLIAYANEAKQKKEVA